MIQNERELEDYICNHQEEFIKTLKGIYGEDENIVFLGRQVRIGEHNIADLIYYFDNDVCHNGRPEFTERNYIVVELKYRKLEPKDLAQLSRYMTTLSEKLYSEEKYYRYEHSIKGVFVSFGEDSLMQEIAIYLKDEDISFLTIKTNVTFTATNWEHTEKYIDNLQLDERIEQFYKEV